jgi:hypothetical protein
VPVTARIARTIVSLLAGSSALRFKKPADSGQAIVSSLSSTEEGCALWSTAARCGASSCRLSSTAGHSSANASGESSTLAAKLGSGAGASGSTTATAATAGAGSPSVASSAETAVAASSAIARACSWPPSEPPGSVVDAATGGWPSTCAVTATDVRPASDAARPAAVAGSEGAREDGAA